MTVGVACVERRNFTRETSLHQTVLNARKGFEVPGGHQPTCTSVPILNNLPASVNATTFPILERSC